MSFSLSTFLVEINGTPTITFQAKWHAEADRICRGWSDLHWDELLKEQHGRLELPPPINKVRLATSVEKAAYEAADQDVEIYGEVKIVRLVDAIEHEDEAGESALTDNQANDTAAEREDAHDDDRRNSTSEAAPSTNSAAESR